MKIHGNTITVLIMSGIIVAVFIGYSLLQKNTNKNDVTTHGTDHVTMNQKQNIRQQTFNDGLGKTKDKIGYKPDETGVGVTKIETFLFDINSDGKDDKITRIHHENGTAHFWDEYTIELNENNRFRTVITDDFRTINGAECALQKLKFIFKPKFQVIKISRPWTESWITPSMATQTTYELINNKMVMVESKKLSSVCDVTELFVK
jgi:hypothetical protein